MLNGAGNGNVANASYSRISEYLWTFHIRSVCGWTSANVALLKKFKIRYLYKKNWDFLKLPEHSNQQVD